MAINRSALEKYPYVVGKRGICFARIDETIGIETVDSFTESGKPIEARLLPYGIQAYDRSTLPLALYMGSELSSTVNESGVVSFSLFTCLCRMFHHPDMYAREFIPMSLSFFESNGYETLSWRDVWYPYSVNYKAYKKAIKNGLSEVESAIQTWSGNTAFANMVKPLGECLPSYSEEGAIIFKFVRT